MEETIALINQIIDEHKTITQHARTLEQTASDVEALAKLEEAKEAFMPGRLDQKQGLQKLRELLEGVLPANSTVEDYLVEHEFPAIGFRRMVLNARQLVPGDGDATMIMLAIEDVTDHR